MLSCLLDWEWPSAPSFPDSLPLPASVWSVAQFVALRAAACVGAKYSNLALLTTDGDALRLFHNPSLDAEIAARYTDVPLDAAVPDLCRRS